MAAAHGRIGGRYRLDRQIASGGMGTVWQGWDERLQRPVAVKKLHLEPWLTQADRHAAAARTMREARIAARLHHANAVQVFDVVDDGDAPCLIMEYVPSRSLGDIVHEDGPFSPAEVAWIGAQIAAALAAAHRTGIVHRDVKPGNVLITDVGTAKLSDFGISHAFGDVTVTSTGMVTGTPGFLAPEVARGGASTFASDVYSLGSTLYMAVEGRPPFGSNGNPMALMHRVASGHWDAPTRSGRLGPILTRMMSVDPRMRPSMVEVANVLTDLYSLTEPRPAAGAGSNAMAHQPTSAFAASGPPASGTRVLTAPPPLRRPTEMTSDRHRRRSWLPLVAVGVIVVVAAVLATVLLHGNGTGNRAASGRRSAAAAPPKTPANSAAPTQPNRSATSSKPTNSPTASAASKTPTKSQGQPPAGVTTQDLANAVVDYFRMVPGDLDAGWAQLTPHFQQTRAQNRTTYDAYWGTVSSVEVSNALGQLPDTATATLTYHYKDGRVVNEQTTFRFVRQGGTLKIDNET